MTPGPQPDDAYAVFGLPQRFDLDPSVLERRWLQAIARLHPDRTSPDDDSQSRAARLNSARAILENPEARADHLLVLLGGPTKEDDRSLPDGLLEEMLEARSEMESDLAHDADAASERWGRWAHERRRAHLENVRSLFAAIPESGDDQALRREIRKELNAWRYTERLIEQLGAPVIANRPAGD